MLDMFCELIWVLRVSFCPSCSDSHFDLVRVLYSDYYKFLSLYFYSVEDPGVSPPFFFFFVLLPDS